ncbi:MAG: cell division protein SepF [Bacillales bacterium]|jgi:FtsZ-interacting cell division protein YlmF|nr:cell division protein SepF [Bacillales bacterium]
MSDSFSFPSDREYLKKESNKNDIGDVFFPSQFIQAREIVTELELNKHITINFELILKKENGNLIAKRMLDYIAGATQVLKLNIKQISTVVFEIN